MQLPRCNLYYLQSIKFPLKQNDIYLHYPQSSVSYTRIPIIPPALAIHSSRSLPLFKKPLSTSTAYYSTDPPQKGRTFALSRTEIKMQSRAPTPLSVSLFLARALLSRTITTQIYPSPLPSLYTLRRVREREKASARGRSISTAAEFARLYDDIVSRAQRVAGATAAAARGERMRATAAASLFSKRERERRGEGDF